MEQHIRRWAEAAQRFMAPYGVSITGARWYVPHRGQRSHSEIYACLDGAVDNTWFLGMPYTNWRRNQLMAFAYETALSMPEPLPVTMPALDMRLALPPDTLVCEPSPLIEAPPKHGTRDSTRDHDVRLVSLKKAMSEGTVEPGTVLDEYCTRYDIEHILTHGRHAISPDSASVELLEDLMDVWPVRSVLEIGAGVGVCGVAAKRRGIRDFTFVDIVPEVCTHATRLTGFRAWCADAMDYPLERKWDLITIGLPYEVLPGFLAERGRELARACDMVTFQSGCRSFCDWEHDWLMGRPSFARWPWYHAKQTLGAYFPYVFETSVDWQLAVVGCTNEEMYHALRGRQNEKQLYWQNERVAV